MLQNEEFHSLYRSPNIIRITKSIRLRWADHVTRTEEGMSTFTILAAKPTGKRPLGRPRHGRENNTRKDLKEICVSTKNCVDSTQDRDYWRALVNAAL